MQKLSWDGELSIENLRSKGLVNVYNEWECLKDSFDADLDSIRIVKSWLRLQSEPFRTSHLTDKFIDGYIRWYCMLGKDVAQDIRNMIMGYCNLIFVKMIYDGVGCNKYEIKTFDTNLTLRTLTKLLEIEHKDKWKTEDVEKVNKRYFNAESMYSDYVKLWFKYGMIKCIYPVSSPRGLVVTEENLNCLNIDSSKWMEIPDDYLEFYAVELSLQSIDTKLNYDQVLEIGVDFYEENEKKWLFKQNDKQILSRDKWFTSLETGDIINAKDERNNWYEALVRYVDGTKLYIHWIGWSLRWDEILDFGDENVCKCLDKRYSHCAGPQRHCIDTNKQQKIRDLKDTCFFSWRF